MKAVCHCRRCSERRLDWSNWNASHKKKGGVPSWRTASKIVPNIGAKKPVKPHPAAPGATTSVAPKAAPPAPAKAPPPAQKPKAAPPPKPPAPKPPAAPPPAPAAPERPAASQADKAALNSALGTLGADERAALDQGFAKAQASGFKGDLSDFLASQVALYQHAQEGDQRLMTWFGDSVNQIANGPAKAYIQALVAHQQANPTQMGEKRAFDKDEKGHGSYPRGHGNAAPDKAKFPQCVNGPVLPGAQPYTVVHGGKNVSHHDDFKSAYHAARQIQNKLGVKPQIRNNVGRQSRDEKAYINYGPAGISRGPGGDLARGNLKPLQYPHMAETIVDNRTRKRTNPTGVKPPKGSAPAPGKSIGPIKVAPSQTAPVGGAPAAPAGGGK